MDEQKALKDIFYLLLGIFLIFLFNPVFEIFFQTHLDRYASKLTTNNTINILFGLILLVSTAITINDCKNTVPNKKNTFFFFLIILLYTYHRFYRDFFDFLPENYDIKYFDALYLIFSLSLGNYLKLATPLKKMSKSKLYGDSPIKKTDDNLLGTSLDKFVEKIHKIVTENSFETAYTIGINSQWGDGKTSSLNLLKEKFSQCKHDSDYILIEFNPWLSFDGNVLIEDFFNSISEKLSNDSLSRQFSIYSAKLTDKDSEWIAILKHGIPYISTPSLETIFNEINNKLGILNKKLVIVIDDIDRLDNQEVYQLLKLVRNTANFRNTFFVLAYDRDYINNAINKINCFPSNNYLNKIINLELSLPFFDKSILSQLFIDNVLRLIGDQYREKIVKVVESLNSNNIFFSGRGKGIGIGYWISNIRDLKRLADSIYVNFNEILDDVDFQDMLIVEILHIKYPNVYRLIYDKKDLIFFESQGSLYIKTKTSSSIQQEEDIQDFNASYFVENLNQLIQKGYLLEEDKDTVIELFRKLFTLSENSPRVLGAENDYSNTLRAKKARRFERYFAQNISRQNLKESEWTSILQYKSIELLEQEIAKLVEQGKEEDLIERLSNSNNYKSVNEYQNVIKTIFILSRTHSKIFTGTINIGSNILIEKLVFPSKEIKNNLKNDLQRIEDLLKEELNEATIFNLDFLYQLYSDASLSNNFHSNFLFLSRSEIHDILKTYFKNIVNKKGLNAEHFWNYYHGAKTLEFKEEIQQNNLVRITKHTYIDDDIKEEFIKASQKDEISTKIFLNFFIQSGPPTSEKNLYYIRKDFIEEVFGTIENFEKYVKLLTCNDSFIAKFMKFYDLCKSSNFSEYEELT